MRRAAIVATALMFVAAGASAQGQAPAAGQTADDAAAALLRSNEIAIGTILEPGAPLAADPLAVFAEVLARLPARVTVYPTENYYYLRFIAGGVAYTGNIRLGAADRGRGIVHFSYGERPTDWNPEPEAHHVALGREQGVAVEAAGALTYRVTYRDRSVTFALNDLSSYRPSADLVRPDEVLLGPVQDESGMRFVLVFNRRLKVFHYILDPDAAKADRFVPVRRAGPTEIGVRTGFAFYRHEGRRILIGADARQSRLNTFFDGPFDQLPENWIEGETLRDAIVAADPETRGRIDRLGVFLDGSGRFLVHPYMLYRSPSDLRVFHRCVTARKVAASDWPRCFVIDDGEAQRRHPRPLPLAGR